MVTRKRKAAAAAAMELLTTLSGKHAERTAQRLNELLRDVSFRGVEHGRVILDHLSALKRKEVSEDYREAFHKWATGGAIEQLRDLLDKNTSPGVPTFVPGDHLDACFDTQLTGGTGDDRHTKDVRIWGSSTGPYFLLTIEPKDEAW